MMKEHQAIYERHSLYSSMNDTVYNLHSSNYGGEIQEKNHIALLHDFGMALGLL
jgi:hypothetical protein